MTTDPAQRPEGANWGDPPPAEPAKRWSGKKTAAAAGIAVAIAAAGGVAIYAGTSANGSEQAGGRMTGPGGGMGGAPREALHGDFVVSDGNGGYTTERMQTGEVTAISATSITAASKDGYTQTYAIDAGTRKTSDPKTGDTVTVIAKVTGQTATATSIGEGDAMRGQPPGMGGQRQPGQQGGRRGDGT
ncbi:hypothetical protein [Amycolatopsis anabasis]|uniref:hypothetical protein n=1 Tax=Amycolatopsis anabasis TaxID=1840409 RepID=UPI00131A813C|nr:hypothetical protein [Amycolatopsis anabasis]